MSRQDLVLEAIQRGSKSSKGYRTKCPFCARSGHQSKKQNLYVSAKSGKWFCYRCHSVGFLDGYDHEAQEEELGEIATFAPPHGWCPLGWGEGASAMFASQARDYATSRNLSRTLLQTAQVGISTLPPPNPKEELDWRGRLIVPILDAEHKTWVGYVGRDYTGRLEPTYQYPNGMSRGRILYNARALLEVTDEPVLVVEGVLDALQFWPDAVAVLGTWTRAHVALLAQSNRPVVAVLDGDAWRKGEGLSLSLKLAGVRSGWIRLPPGMDPDEIKAWVLEEILKWKSNPNTM